MNCTYHCRSCGCHFVSLTAFDKHRSGPLEHRVCNPPDTVKAMRSEKGDCTIASAKKHKNVQVWTTRKV